MQCVPQFTLYNIFIGFCFTVIFILSLLGNSAVVLTITKLKRNTTTSITNLLLLNLAIADLLRSVICIPPTLMSEISRCWLLGPHVCKFAAYLQPVTVCASAYTLAVIALERYYAICRPLESRIWISRRRSLALILFVWLIAFVCNIGALLIYDAAPYKTHWSCRSTTTPLEDFLYQIYITLLLLFIPLTIMLFLYCKVIKTLRQDSQPEADCSYDCMECNQNAVESRNSLANWLYSSFTDQNNKPSADFRMNDSRRKDSPSLASCNVPFRETCNHDTRGRTVSSCAPALRTMFSGRTNGSYDCGYMLRSNHQEKIIEAKRRVTRMLIIIVIAFVICWTPSFIWWLVIRTSDLIQVRLWNSTVNTYITLLTYISTCTNPMTYCFMNKRFRKNIIAHIKCCPFQICRRSLKLKSQANGYKLRRPNLLTKFGGGLFNHSSNVEEAVVVIPFAFDDGL